MRTLLFALILSAMSAGALLAQSPGEKELLKLENDWNVAVLGHDMKFLEKLYAEEYLWTNAEGKVFTRAEDLKSTKEEKSPPLSLILSELKAHVYGEAGLVTGMNTVTSTEKGKTVTKKVRFTDVFVKRDGRWQCVASHGSIVKK
jgi:ketosteroid isomerase-like protein